MHSPLPRLETKFAALDPAAPPDRPGVVEGYAALFGQPDRSGDVIAPGAFTRSLARRDASVKFLWQHDAAQPIGIWAELREDARGLRVRGKLLTDLRRGAEAATLLAAGALDGLSIGFRAVRAERLPTGRRLTEIELWEISLVTFPMAEGARLAAPPLAEDPDLAAAIRDAAQAFTV